jgi:hypothetical protein
MKKIKITKQFLKRLILPTIILVQLVLIACLAWYAYWTHIDVRSQATSPPLTISMLIIRATEALTLPVPTDAQSGRIYIYEAKITLPPPPDRSYSLYYNYRPDLTGAHAELNFMDKQAVDMQKAKVYAFGSVNDVFAAVPKLQACSRGYQIFFAPAGKNDTDGKLVFTKKLKDGRTAYTYLEDLCSDNKDKLTPYLNQMDSY